MSECVVRMDKPKVCIGADGYMGYCPMDRVWCIQRNAPKGITMGEVYAAMTDKVPPWCPIICQLPEGHGRLIDKDEAIESIRTEVTELFFNGLKGTPRPDGDLRFMWNRLEDEDFAPTIVPAERREEK